MGAGDLAVIRVDAIWLAADPMDTRYLDDAQVPIDNNWAENQIRPIAI